MSRAGTPTDNPVNESLNGWIKEELFIDFNIKHCNDVPKLIEEYIFRNIRFSKELYDKINDVKGNVAFTKFVIEAVKYTLDNMED